jgi:hypothetical protein
MSILLLVSTEIPVHNGSPRRKNLPDAARDLISNAPAKSASSAELRRQGPTAEAKHMSKYSGHVSSIYWQKNMPDSTSAWGSIAQALPWKR